MDLDAAYKRILAVPLDVAKQLEDMQWNGPKYRSLAAVVREVAALGMDALEAAENAEAEEAARAS
jgi:hypothetical protein